ncbi:MULTISPECIES: ATP-binding cassette domain-containing protein [Streptomyces]|uniref:ATP-binding cassette domain-containing protein n=1 Tax=Streptomyces TaxID=1883 RepID=UPI001F0F6933|nr:MULTISPECIES: ATP-binding cassette domain-containing protein [Streptomyces]
MGEQAGGVRIAADGLGVKGPRGWAVRGISVDAEPGALVAVEGPSGSGRTCLLLALTGRMKVSEGTAAVGDARLPKQMAAVRGISALAHVPGVNDLDPALTVGEHLRERALLQRRFGASLRGLLRPRGERAAEAERRVDAALEAAGLDLEALPKGPRTAVRDLERLEALRLSIALALVGGPRLLGVDDADLKLSDGEREEVRALLRSLADAGTTVVAVFGEAPEGAVRVSTTQSHDDRAAGDDRPDEQDQPDEADQTGQADQPDEAQKADEPDPADRADRADEQGHPDEPDEADQGEEKADAIVETGRA